MKNIISAAGFFIKVFLVTAILIIAEAIAGLGGLVLPTFLIGAAVALFGGIGQLLPVPQDINIDVDDDFDNGNDPFENSFVTNRNSIHNLYGDIYNKDNL
ncbi:MAG: hypothetical protein HOM14_21630 [Gammaproteobacteria bacterium]|nr:hypothetical protein [Gammaproteobacteria bacterium]MBT4076365.1 hypothetical protein [Gammaproteobacteria bacterium]MBT6553964.1 hypothetical protein [Gammaproteobacteria bacterium]MBT6701421.1 hypothetical protein [Gammaproteobacteria bacterium]